MTDPVIEHDNPNGVCGFTSLPPHTSDGEVADVCVGTTFAKIGSGFVEPYWSNEDDACIINNASTGKTYFTEQVIPNEDTAPDGVVFGQSFDANALHLSSLDPMHAVGFWLKRVVNANARTTLNNRFNLHIEAQI